MNTPPMPQAADAADTACAETTPPEPAAPATPPVASLLLPLDTPPIEIDTEVDDAGMAALLAHTETTWTQLGEEDPHWSVISAEVFRKDSIAGHLDSFYASGAGDVALFKAFLARNGVDPSALRQVLEFGCGLGRVTRFLARDFEQVLACDISASHMRQAREYLQREAVHNVQFQPIRSLDDVAGPAGPDIDAFFSVIVLQHNPPPVIAAILARLLRRLRPGGIGYFQVPTHAADYRFKVQDYLAHGLAARHIEMHYLPQRHVFSLVRQAGCEVLEVREDDWTGRRQLELSNTFLVRRLQH